VQANINRNVLLRREERLARGLHVLPIQGLYLSERIGNRYRGRTEMDLDTRNWTFIDSPSAYVAWVYAKSESTDGHPSRGAGQWLRASQSIRSLTF